MAAFCCIRFLRPASTLYLGLYRCKDPSDEDFACSCHHVRKVATGTILTKVVVLDCIWIYVCSLKDKFYVLCWWWWLVIRPKGLHIWEYGGTLFILLLFSTWRCYVFNMLLRLKNSEGSCYWNIWEWFISFMVMRYMGAYWRICFLCSAGILSLGL